MTELVRGSFVYSNSELTVSRRCLREHFYRYGLNRESAGSRPEALDRGTRMHAWLADFWSGRPFCDVSSFPWSEQAILMAYAEWYQRVPLVDVRVDVPFEATINGVRMVGTLDAIGTDPVDGRQTIVEHKTTTRDISPGSSYWARVSVCDPQVSTYLRAFPEAKVLYDVLHMPDQEPALATPIERRQYTKPSKAEPISRLYKGQRAEDETREAYLGRVLECIAEAPDKHFQRATIVRLEGELAAFEDDTRETARVVQLGTAPRNPDSCFTFGRRCEFFSACWEGVSITSPEFVQIGRNHTEFTLDRARGRK